MKIIDNKGKLLGLINVIDLFVLLSVILLASAVVLRFTGVRDMRHEIGTKPVTVLAVINEVRMETVDTIQVGDQVRDSASGQVFGTIVDKDWEIHRKQVSTADGEVLWAEIPERYSVYVTVEGRGHDLGHVFRLASYELRVGTTVSIYAREYAVAATVLEFEIAE